MQVQSFILGLALLNWFTFGFRFDVRKPTKAELKPVAKIMSDSFDDSPNIFVKWYSELNYEEMLKDRFVRLVEMDSRKHTMFISASNVMDSATVVSGFIEVGLLVLPTNRVPLDGSYNIDSIGIIDGVRDSEVCYEAGDVGPQNMQQTLDAGAGLEGNINADVVSNKSSARYPTIGNVAVRQDYRGKGIARALLSHIEVVVRAWGHDRIVCAVDPKNVPAKKLYESCGYVHRFNSTTTTLVNLRQKQELLDVMVKDLSE